MNLRKRILLLAMSIMLLTGVLGWQKTSFAATNDDIKIYVDSEAISFPDVEPYISNNRTMVPVRFVSEEMGAKVSWDGTTRTVTITKGNDSISLKIGSERIIKNGDAEVMDVAPTIKGSRTMVPIRFVSEQLEADVKWEDSSRSVLISTTNNPNPAPIPAPNSGPVVSPGVASSPINETEVSVSGRNVKDFGALGNGSTNDTAAIQKAINSLKSGETLYFPAGTYPISNLKIANSITLSGTSAILKQLNTSTLDFISVTANDVRFQNLSIQRDISNPSKLDGIVVRGDRFVMKGTNINGFYYSIDVFGDNCLIDNVTVQNSNYAGCRLFAGVKPLNQFTLNNFNCLNSNYKGFVYNGTQGIQNITVNNFKCTYNAAVKPDAVNGFLIDSGDASNTTYRVKNLVVNNANIAVCGSGAFKILNCETATLNNITINNEKTYPSAYGILSSCKNLYINTMTTNDRITVLGNATLKNVDFSPCTLNFSPLELKGSGTVCTLDGFDISKVSNGTLGSILVVRATGLDHDVNIKNFIGNGNKLFAIKTYPPNLTDSLVLYGNVTGYSTLGY